jgi:hypothetical protein
MRRNLKARIYEDYNSISEFAEAFGFSSSAMSYVIRHAKQPTSKMMMAFIQAFGLDDTLELFEDTEKSKLIRLSLQAEKKQAVNG